MNGSVTDRLIGLSLLPSWGGVSVAAWVFILGSCLLLVLWILWLHVLLQQRARRRPVAAGAAGAAALTDGPPDGERRQTYRVQAGMGAALRDRVDGEARRARVVDLSLGGARLQSAAPPPTDVSLVLAVPATGERIECPCAILEVEPVPDGGTVIRARFEPMARDQQALLHRLLVDLQGAARQNGPTGEPAAEAATGAAHG
jgi:hypothetical protein